LYLCLVQRIFSHIERLLLTNDCVVIPEVGGFVLRPCPAVYQPEAHRFCPPHKEIVFNPALAHQDGLLPESYIKMYGMTFNQAQTALKKDIEALQKQIAKVGEIRLEKIGFLRKDDKGQLTFEPDLDSSLLGLKPYGLFPFHLPPVPQYEHKETPVIAMKQADTQPDNVVYVPVKRTFIRAVGVAVAAACLILFVSMPLKEVDPNSYSASVISGEKPANEVFATTSEPEIEIDKTETTPPIAVETPSAVIADNSPVVKTEKPAIQKDTYSTAQPEIPQKANTKVSSSVQTEAQNQKIFYAIIGSFVTEKQANQYIQSIQIPELTNMGTVINDGRVRVYAEKFFDRKEAEKYINLLRANVKLKDTWLYVGR